MSALQLEVAAELLKPMLDEVVSVGGATVHLWLTEQGAPPARVTASEASKRRQAIQSSVAGGVPSRDSSLM